MDPLVILLIVLAVIGVALVAFVMVRKKQRSGSVLAAPSSTNKDRSGS